MITVTIKFKNESPARRFESVEETVHCKNGLEKLHIRKSDGNLRCIAFPVSDIEYIEYDLEE